ncbi:ABC transporter related protein [Methanohalobium evestigatum Z-7303]|uniref:ABC transporter related protein n=1 Tax=Methanohalobium evestigatum (strain ATCC BAA-1072 / DSM 3721 / NBRC 107634 / OCM 161 / Z-7303) TaxID=644295 RepID=D7E7S1_METEZ|nr:ABC transporter ATP-binding protein [Methanohalobium evestigatum]ADI74144.1 ABC transporter related protein [Methanohalobium evestigatum Z-7303]
MSAIQVKNLTKTFGDFVAVDNISFEVANGEFFGLLGPNGAGKTTIIRMIVGLLTPNDGSILIQGLDIIKDVISAKMKLSTVPETGNVYTDLSARENIQLAGKFYGLSKKEIAEKSDELLNELGLFDRRDDPVINFSKGMRQRVSIACAVINEPDILILDEPTEGLDVQSRRLLINKMKQMNENGTTVILTTHNIEEANQLCERVCIINKGKIAAIDRPETLTTTFDKTQSIEISFNRSVTQDFFEPVSVYRIENYGDKWRLYTSSPDRTIKHLSKIAENQDLEIVSLRTLGPSLEEAFVSLTEVEK